MPGAQRILVVAPEPENFGTQCHDRVAKVVEI
jgi:hypothetical protein